MYDQPTGTTPEKYYNFCPRCGAPLALKFMEGRQRIVCTKGDFVFYQNPHAATAALVVNGAGEVLLVKRNVEPRKGAWDVPGGFVDWGEDPAEGLVREMREELGVRFTPEALVDGYHDWYDSQRLAVSVVILYYEGTIDGELKPADDVSEFRWFALDALPDDLAFPHVREALAALARRRAAA